VDGKQVYERGVPTTDGQFRVAVVSPADFDGFLHLA